jgi:hypothetical protein
MRHFLRSALTIGVLPSSVLARSLGRPLVARAGPPEGLTTLHRSALTPAVDLSVITPPADPNLPTATRAVEEPVAVPDRQRPAAPRLDRSLQSGHAPLCLAEHCGP